MTAYNYDFDFLHEMLQIFDRNSIVQGNNILYKFFILRIFFSNQRGQKYLNH